jgi:heme O synthase-like polyprenyltransferase
MLHVIEPDCRSTARWMVLFGLLLPVSLPRYLHMTGIAYAAGAAVLGASYLLSGIRAVQTPTVRSARRVLPGAGDISSPLYVLWLPTRSGKMMITCW